MNRLWKYALVTVFLIAVLVFLTFLDRREVNEYHSRTCGGVRVEFEAGVDKSFITEEDVKRTLPKVQGETIPENCIYLPKESTDSGVLISSVDMKEPEKVMDQKLIFSGYSTLYVTKDSIILYCSVYKEESVTYIICTFLP